MIYLKFEELKLSWGTGGGGGGGVHCGSLISWLA